jgi:hypothetical protein
VAAMLVEVTGIDAGRKINEKTVIAMLEFD